MGVHGVDARRVGLRHAAALHDALYERNVGHAGLPVSACKCCGGRETALTKRGIVCAWCRTPVPLPPPLTIGKRAAAIDITTMDDHGRVFLVGDAPIIPQPEDKVR